MKRGEISAVVFVTSKPVDAFLRGRWEPGFKFLPVEYDTKFEDYYLPSSIEAMDYPNLVPKGEQIATVAVPTVLLAYNWPQQSDRYRRVARLVDHLFSRFGKLQSRIRPEVEGGQPARQGAESGALPARAGMA